MEAFISFVLIVGMAIIIGSAILDQIIEHWPVIRTFFSVVFGVAALVWVYYIAEKKIKKDQDANAARIAANTAANAKLAQHRQAEQRARSQAVEKIKATLNSAKEFMQLIPSCLESAEQSVVRAGHNFENRSFYPFWDSVAEAVSHLSVYKANIERLDQRSVQYAEQVENYRNLPGAKGEDLPKPFPASNVSLPALRNGAETAERISALYNHAHRDFEFSNIYANWKTNQTLVAGFDNMSRGLDAIRDDLQSINFTLNDGFDSVNASVKGAAQAIAGAIYDQTDTLTNSIETQTDTLTNSIETLGASSGNQMGDLADQLTTARKEQRSNEAEMIDLLDNIQRRRERLPGIQDTLKQVGTRPVSAT
jgi:DNA anti-recombination protein RmuC